MMRRKKKTRKKPLLQQRPRSSKAEPRKRKTTSRKSMKSELKMMMRTDHSPGNTMHDFATMSTNMDGWIRSMEGYRGIIGWEDGNGGISVDAGRGYLLLDLLCTSIKVLPHPNLRACPNEAQRISNQPQLPEAGGRVSVHLRLKVSVRVFVFSNAIARG
jgi:hypothetical protein